MAHDRENSKLIPHAKDQVLGCMDVPELYSRRAPGNTCLAAVHSIDEGREARNNSCGYGGGYKK